jgi:ribosome-associated protein
MTPDELKALTIDALEELKGRDIVALDVRPLTGVTDHMIFCTGTSGRHVKSLADNVEEKAREAGVRPIGVEGKDGGEWVLVDFGDVVLHVMQAEARAFYDIERLWRVPAAGASRDAQ